MQLLIHKIIRNIVFQLQINLICVFHHFSLVIAFANSHTHTHAPEAENIYTQFMLNVSS